MVTEIVRRHLNQPAKKVALVTLFLYLCLGYFLKIQLNFDRQNWTENFPVMRGYLRAAHVHGLTLSFLLIFYSFLIEFSGLGEKIKKVAVTLAICGCVLMPLTLVLSAFNIKIMILSHLSVIMILTAVGILAVAHLRKKI